MKVARNGDYNTAGATLISNSSVYVNNKSIGVVGDGFSDYRTILNGSSNVYSNSKAIARVGDLVSDYYSISTGSDNVFNGG